MQFATSSASIWSLASFSLNFDDAVLIEKRRLGDGAYLKCSAMLTKSMCNTSFWCDYDQQRPLLKQIVECPIGQNDLLFLPKFQHVRIEVVPDVLDGVFQEASTPAAVARRIQAVVVSSAMAV